MAAEVYHKRRRRLAGAQVGHGAGLPAREM